MNRSFLFAPGNQPRRVEKAFLLDADAVILDLEDSVAMSEKEATRKRVAEALAQPRKCRGYVRVNAMGTAFCFRDLIEVVGRGLDGVVLPKVESAADLHAIDWMLANLERERGLALGAIDLSPIIETAAGLSRIERIVAAFREAEARGAAAVQVDGQMVDYPIVHQAERLLKAGKNEG